MAEHTGDGETGVLVRREIASWLRAQLAELSRLVPAAVDDLGVEVRDGTGRKTEIPWVRIFSASRSPSATVGFYVVYLLSGAGGQAYLSLNQGTTRWENGIVSAALMYLGNMVDAGAHRIGML